MLGHIKRNAVAYSALIVALSTSAYAGVTLEKDSVTGYHVDESTLRRVPRVWRADKAKSQPVRVVKLDESVEEPATPPSVLKVGRFTFHTTCQKDLEGTIVDISMTAPDQFVVDRAWNGSTHPPGGFASIVHLRTTGGPIGKGTVLAATTQSGEKSHVLTGHVSARLRYMGSDCIATFSLLTNRGDL